MYTEDYWITPVTIMNGENEADESLPLFHDTEDPTLKDDMVLVKCEIMLTNGTDEMTVPFLYGTDNDDIGNDVCKYPALEVLDPYSTILSEWGDKMKVTDIKVTPIIFCPESPATVN